MLVLPSITVPAACSRSTIVALYGGRQPSRIFDAAVVGTPLVATMSLTATGTPANGPEISPLSTLSAAASAPERSTCKKAWTRESTASIRSRCACATSTAETSLLLIFAARSAAVSLVRSVMSGLLVQNPRHPEPALERVGRAGERLLLREARLRDVVAIHIRQRHGVRGGRNVVRGHLADPRDRLEDHVELPRELIQFLLGHGEPRQAREMRDLFAGDGGHHALLS